MSVRFAGAADRRARTITQTFASPGTNLTGVLPRESAVDDHVFAAPEQRLCDVAFARATVDGVDPGKLPAAKPPLDTWIASMTIAKRCCLAHVTVPETLIVKPLGVRDPLAEIVAVSGTAGLSADAGATRTQASATRRSGSERRFTRRTVAVLRIRP